MISQLSIENIALIDNLTLEFGSGLNVMTGETGAGKSIIIDAVNLVLGERADKELIQSGKESARVEILFMTDNDDRIKALLNDFGIGHEEDGALLLMRELTVQGKNTCRANGRTVTLSMMKEISRLLVDIHGQHRHQSLLQPEKHMEILDRFGGSRLNGLKEKLKVCYNEWKSVRRRIKKLSGIAENGRRQEELLLYQINEINNAKLVPGEEESLKEERALLQNAEKIISIVNEVYDMLYTGSQQSPPVSDLISHIVSRLSQIQNFNKELDNTACALEDINYQLEDIVMGLRSFRDNFEYEPERLDAIEERLDLIHGLKRKYGKTIEEILTLKDEMEEELFELKNSQSLLEELDTQSEKLFAETVNLCAQLSEERKRRAQKLEKDIMVQLSELNMDKTKFKISINHPAAEQLDYRDDNPGISENGYDSVEFLISPNPGEPLKPLSKIISGGEMSRVMLALKTILGEADEIPTLIFDEIDVGISGRTAGIVGDKLNKLSQNHQIICVTHLPQIAAKADFHYIIEKTVNNNVTRTTVKKLDLQERQYEIARMIGGSTITKLSIEHAKELISDKN